jgi:sulfur transfer complex TusBCD TusB component (DsrH family)
MMDYRRDPFLVVARAITVADVMTPAAELQRAATGTDARSLLSKFDVVPYPALGEIRGYFHKGRRQYRALTQSDLVSDSTSLLSLPLLLARRKFFFVLSQDAITGYVHYSDLNRTVSKLPFYALFEDLEARLWDRINSETKSADVEAVFGPKHAKRLLDEKRKREKADTDIGWTGLLSFADILRLAKHHGLIALTATEQSTLVSKRNAVAHPDHPLVAHYLEVKQLLNVRDLCVRLVSALPSNSGPSNNDMQPAAQ